MIYCEKSVRNLYISSFNSSVVVISMLPSERDFDSLFKALILLSFFIFSLHYNALNRDVCLAPQAIQ